MCVRECVRVCVSVSAEEMGRMHEGKCVCLLLRVRVVDELKRKRECRKFCKFGMEKYFERVCVRVKTEEMLPLLLLLLLPLLLLLLLLLPLLTLVYTLGKFS